MGEFIEYTFGDLEPDDYEAMRPNRVLLDDLQVGTNYTFMYRSQVIGGQQYYSKYPVQVADIRNVEGGADVELVHWEVRSENWPVGPQALFIDIDGLIRVEEKSDGTLYDHGYLIEPEQPDS